MPTALKLELIRQALRWLAIFLATLGLPEPLLAFLGDPQTVNWVLAAIAYLVADTGWLASKITAARKGA